MTNDLFKLCFAGSGGQGVILTSIILAQAAVLSGKKVVQSQAYGPEARGGSCVAETIISTRDIWFTKMAHPDFLLALTQQALEEHCRRMLPGGDIVMDSSLKVPEGLSEGVRVIALPILQAANVTVGSPMTANIVAAGALNATIRLFTDDVLKEAVRRHVPKGTEQLNLYALEVGKQLGAKAAA